ncbi:tetratricopeptide repeat protein [Parvularcula sp. ZS-1/3]|uniref:Tetratricopeptide repeat protein n=1 Tax=Parvularcula mediterranea TaxID=2732508 RepID=A0A7Y3RK54_9PROT|nr:tetratricopeptide repeat protein [Parvularcula mediterranea]NNU15475.1 tetratricopeptide repeat protein [Parvularcula mediterranea]
MTKNRLLAAAFGFMMAASFPASAQDNEEAADQAEAEADDTIVIEVPIQRDNAMDAFRRGDYAKAEVEFNLNARCALRREREQEAAFENARRDAARGETQSQSQSTTPSGASGPGQGGSSNQGASSGGSSVPNNVRDEGEESKERTCENRGFQLYMKGLSQLQLGKTEDAKKNFQTAISLDPMLYDAHYKLGLIALLEGDEGTAKRRLRSIKTVLRRCRKCEAKDEIEQRITHLEAAIAGEVELR